MWENGDRGTVAGQFEVAEVGEILAEIAKVPAHTGKVAAGVTRTSGTVGMHEAGRENG